MSAAFKPYSQADPEHQWRIMIRGAHFGSEYLMSSMATHLAQMERKILDLESKVKALTEPAEPAKATKPTKPTKPTETILG